jgi:hypothetical protein
VPLVKRCYFIGGFFLAKNAPNTSVVKPCFFFFFFFFFVVYESIEELQNALDVQNELVEKDRKRDEQIKEIRQESKCQFDLIMSHVLGKMVVW